jgi:hypothetical protein
VRDQELQSIGTACSTAKRFVLAVIVCSIITSNRPAHACCQLGGTACGDPFAVSCNNGVVCFPPWRTCPDCTCTTTNAGHTCLATTSEPGTVSTLLIDKHAQTAGDLDVTWGASCSASGPDYSIHEGQLGLWFSHAPLRCTSGGARSVTITPSGGDRYYLVAPIAAGFTGSLGTASTGSERPDGSPSCTDDRALAPCP